MLRLANGVAASWGVEVEGAWPRDWGRVEVGQWRGGLLGCGGGVGVATSGCGHGIGVALVLANGVAACWGVDVEWARDWGRVGFGQWRGGLLGCECGVGVATGLGESWFWPMAWRLFGVWMWSGHGHEEVAMLRLANGVAACWGVDVEWAWSRVG